MKRYLLPLVLAGLLLAGAPAALAAAGDAFSPVRTYEGQFTDVGAGDWYYSNVKALYELGLTNGQGGADRFAPQGDLSVAEILTMAARLRSLYETGDCEAGPGESAGGQWYEPYVSYLQGLQVIGDEFEGAYGRPAARAEMAYVLARTLPEELFDPINQDIVAAGYERGLYITDVTGSTPYQQEILLLYEWGILDGADRTGSFCPNENIPRCQAAAMVTRLAYGSLRIRLDWELPPAYSKRGTAMADLVDSDGTFYAAPAPDAAQEIDANVRYMLSQGERRIVLHYPPDSLERETVDALTQAFLSAARLYVEQTYNNVLCSYSSRSGVVSINFSSSLYEISEVDRYREETRELAVAVHDGLWAAGDITQDMTDSEKARVYYTWICNHCRYDFASTDTSMSHSGYRAFAEGLAVCDGYTAAYNLLLKLEGIPCSTASTADHIWTVAELDGESVHIDTTWGDRTGSIAYQYFAMAEADSLARFA